MSFPKNRRMSKYLIDAVLSGGRSVFSKNLSLKVLDNNFPAKNTRNEIILPENLAKNSLFTFVVPKKVSNKATVRNLIKRRSRHIIRDRMKEIKNGFLCVFFFKKGSEKLSFIDLKSEMESLLGKSGLISEAK